MRREREGASSRMSRLARWALWLPVAAYALSVARSFFLYSGSAVYLSTDDALANIAYAIATEGRYGFLSSPILFEMPRHQGLFSYGPFYFYAAAALVWLFGYSLTVVRSVHLLVILGIAFAAQSWLGRTAASAAGAITAVSLLATFERGQWPMVRPDSMVSLFAVGLVISAGLAIRTGLVRYWTLAGLAAACGALTHLVAWSLIPSSLVMVALSVVFARRSDASRGSWPAALVRGALALAAGGIAGAVLFYSSFDFRFGDQLRFVAGYQDYTGSMAAAPAGAGAVGSLMLQHFKLAYWFLPGLLQYVVLVTLVVGIGVVVFLVARPDAAAAAMIVPPVVVWVGYLLSLGFYNNFHAGYTILNQVMAVWCLGALIALALDTLARYRPRRASGAVAAAWVVAFAYAVGVMTFLEPRTEYRALAAGSAVPIDDYTSRVLEPLPADARAWGSVVFGIEHPGRVQLVQLDDALTMAQALEPPVRESLAPDYLILGASETGASAINTLRGDTSLPLTLTNLLPGSRFELAALTAAAPYGVTRVYTRRHAAQIQPTVSVYDARLRQWTRAMSPPTVVATATAPAAQFQVEGQGGARREAIQTLSGELEAGAYVLRMDLAPDAAVDLNAVFAASSGRELRGSFGEYGHPFDVAPYFPGSRSVELVYVHAGGVVYVSQFGGDRGSIAAVHASRLLPLTDFNALRRPAPEDHALRATEWTLPEPIPQAGSLPVTITHTPGADGRSLVVAGNAVQFAYQAYGPKIPVEPFSFVRLRLAAEIQNGRACWGVLDGTGERWLVLPDRLEAEYEFQVNDSGTIKPVLADCTGAPRDVAPVKATIFDGSFATWPARGELYVDELVREFRRRR